MPLVVVLREVVAMLSYHQRPIRVSPSLLSANFANMGADAAWRWLPAVIACMLM